MNLSLGFIRLFFVILSVLVLSVYTTTAFAGGLTLTNLIFGVVGGALFGLALVGMDQIFKRFNLRAFNTALLGLCVGLIMAEAIFFLLNTVLELSAAGVSPENMKLLRSAIYLFSIYVSMIMVARAAEELHVSLPFIKLKPTSHKKKDILLDASILHDSRIIDLASSGLLDHHLIIPRFIIKELTAQSESEEESVKTKARRSLDVFKKLENLSSLDLRYADTDFPEVKDPMSKMVRMARLLDANIMTSDINRVQQSTIEGILIINIHSLSNALKPITQAGEQMNIKIQRYGKEPRQGVGYLEDGTMVVVNGGAEYIGETIKVQVLSVKHTSSGRMIFCNTMDEHSDAESVSRQLPQSNLDDHQPSSFFAR